MDMTKIDLTKCKEAINKINADILKLDSIGADINQVSDGYHTYGQLYYQRMMLFSILVNLFPELSWKTKKHEDGELCFEGRFFLVTIETPDGAYGYHYETKYWDLFNCKELPKAKHWDGYTEKDVTRLMSLLRE